MNQNLNIINPKYCLNNIVQEYPTIEEAIALKCADYFESEKKFDSAVNILKRCGLKNVQCMKRLAEIVFYNDLTNYHDSIIRILNAISHEKNVGINNMLGGLFLKKGSQDDLLVAEKYFMKAYKTDSSIALQNLAELAFSRENYKESLKYLNKLKHLNLKSKHLEQYINWARLYAQHFQYGYGVTINNEKATELYREIVELDKTGATYFLLGDMALNNSDIKKAIFFFEKSTEFNYRNALKRLGYMYMRGYKVEKDIGKALDYYKKAGILGSASALYNSGTIFQQQKKYIEMKVALIKAAKLGHLKATSILSQNNIDIDNYLLFDGKLTEKN
jgi:TPR repeat protein